MRQSNRTDNESAKMATGKGVIQGYTGVAAMDGQHQIIVEAQAHGTGSEQEVLLPVVSAMTGELTVDSLITADAGYHSEANLKQLAAMRADALIPGNNMRQRDERFATQERHREKPDPLYDKPKNSKPARDLTVYQLGDFTYDAEARSCVCPAGKSLYRACRDLITRGYAAEHFRGAKRDCRPCTHRAKCLRTPETTQTRQVACFRGRVSAAPPTHTARMKARIDSPEGRARYAQRFGTVEPVFANVCYNTGLTRFTLRGHRKVDGHWKLFCLTHNIEKLAHHGYAA